MLRYGYVWRFYKVRSGRWELGRTIMATKLCAQLLLISQHIILALIIFCPSNRFCVIVISGSFQEAARLLGAFVSVIRDCTSLSVECAIRVIDLLMAIYLQKLQLILKSASGFSACFAHIQIVCGTRAKK